MATEAPRIDPQAARTRLQSEEGALLVCAYGDTEKCASMELDGAIPFTEFEKKAADVPKDRTVVFY